MAEKWIVVAERAGARIFAKQREGLTLVRTIAHAAGRLRDAEVGTDRPGRTFSSSAHGRHALEQPVSPHEQDALVFARTLAEELRRGRLEGRISSLTLVAEPHFLGVLRAALDAPTEKLVTQTLPKDLQHLPEEELRGRLEQF